MKFSKRYSRKKLAVDKEPNIRSIDECRELPHVYYGSFIGNNKISDLKAHKLKEKGKAEIETMWNTISKK